MLIPGQHDVESGREKRGAKDVQEGQQQGVGDKRGRKMKTALGLKHEDIVQRQNKRRHVRRQWKTRSKAYQ
jgi:hypothetical protein